jgi:hypothetical protein
MQKNVQGYIRRSVVRYVIAPVGAFRQVLLETAAAPHYILSLSIIRCARLFSFSLSDWPLRTKGWQRI